MDAETDLTYQAAESEVRMELNFFQLIGCLTAFLLIMLTFVLGAHRLRKETGNRILALFLLFNALLLIGFSFHGIRMFRYLRFYYLLGPLLFLYTKYLCQADLKFQKRDILHGLPFVACGLALVYRDTFQTRNLSIELWINIILHVQILVYVISTFRRILMCRTRLKDYYSSTEKTNISWFFFIVFCFVAMWAMDLLNWILYSIPAGSRAVHQTILFLSLTVNFVFAALIVYQGLKHTELFAAVYEKSKYEWSRLSHSEKEQYLNKLTRCMEAEKPYFIPSLTIKDLSEKTAIPHRHLSQVINELLKKNFYDYVNEYRIEAAKRLLAESGARKKTVLEILYEVGFNSKSAFNLAFKQHTGITPKEFKRSSH